MEASVRKNELLYLVRFNVYSVHGKCSFSFSFHFTDEIEVLKET